MPVTSVNPIFNRKSFPCDHLNVSIIPWMFTFPLVKCISDNPRYRKNRLGKKKQDCIAQSVSTNLSSISGFLSEALIFLYFISLKLVILEKNVWNFFKRYHLDSESIKFKNEASLQGVHNASVSIHCEGYSELCVILPKWYLLVYWKGIGIVKRVSIFSACKSLPVN